MNDRTIVFYQADGVQTVRSALLPGSMGDVRFRIEEE